MCRAKDIRAAQLDLEASEPPLRHADIVRWPLNDDPAMQKAQQKDRALQIAQNAELIVF